MKDFYELTVEVQALATSVEETRQEGLVYPDEVIAQAIAVAGAIGRHGAELVGLFEPVVGISVELDKSLQASAKKAKDPVIAEQVEILRADLASLDEPETRVAGWLKDTRLLTLGSRAVRSSSLISLIEDAGLELKKDEVLEAESVVEARELELESIPKSFELDTDQLLQVADSLFAIMVQNSKDGIFARKEDILKDPRFKNLPEFGSNPASRSIRTALGQAWEIMVLWFEEVDKGHDIFERRGEARGRGYKLQDLELLTLLWMEPFDSSDKPEEMPRVMAKIAEEPEVINSIDFINGVIVLEDRKIELGEPEKSILALIGTAKSKALSVGFIRDNIGRRFGLTKTDAAVAVDNVLNLVADGVDLYYSKKKNKKMVKLKR